jgi:hypothetical protein
MMQRHFEVMAPVPEITRTMLLDLSRPSVYVLTKWKI